MSVVLLGMAWGALGAAAILGLDFAIPLRPFFAIVALFVFTGSVLAIFGY